jgi:hypothetical protein
MANARYYRDVDWALDISGARFTSIEMDLAGIPARLIRRDPDLQIVMTRAQALEGAWLEPLAKSKWRFAVSAFLRSGFDDFVLVACERGRYFDEERESLRRLRSAGAAVSD